MITQRERLTSLIYKLLKEIQEENDVELSAKSFIADFLAPKLIKSGWIKEASPNE